MTVDIVPGTVNRMPRKSDSRQRMLGAAVSLIQRQGYHATGLKQVVEESNTPRGSIYFHFPEGKDQMIGEALGIAKDAVAGTIDRVADRSETPAAFVEGLGVAMAKWLTRSDFVEGCPVATVALEVAPLHDTLTSASEQAFTHWIDQIAGHLVRFGLDADEADAVAVSSMAALEGGMILARVRRDAAPLRTAMARIAATV